MNFTVYKSSAGSGKTYTLVKEYLKLALHSDNTDFFRNILAITFTNKAASEMKERIMGALKILSMPETSETDYSLLNDLINELDLEKPIINIRSAKVLEAMLHNYSDLSISTIDKFTYKIIRTFAHDLHLPVNFNVELDGNKILKQAVDLLISKVGNDELLTKVLIEFVDKKTEEAKSWDIEKDLIKFSENLLKEDGLEFIKNIKHLKIEDFIIIRKNISSYLIAFENNISKYGQEGLNTIKLAQINEDYLAGGATTGIGKYFNYLIQKRTDKLTPTNTLSNNISQNKWHSSKCPKSEQASVYAISEQLSNIFFEATSYIDKNLERYSIYHLIIKNIYGLILLNELEQLIEEIKKENNTIHISEFNKRIAEIVIKEPTPFIYERLGERYQHYLIDEFQDTSVLQWQNLLPLIDNSLAYGKFNMIVGDGKQSIYRWRGGEVEQFSKLPKVFNPSGNTLIEERQHSLERNYNEKILGRNFRSKFEIVDFNNKFFRSLSQSISENYRNIYDSLEQEYNPENSGGLAQIEFIYDSFEEQLSNNDLQCHRLIELIDNAISDGFSLNDITILTRTNKDGALVASFLVENNISVISSESLVLGNNQEIKFLIAVLNYLTIGDNKQGSNIFIAQMLEYLLREKTGTEELHDILKEILEDKSRNKFHQFLKERQVIIDRKHLLYKPIFEICESLIRLFNFDKQPDIYIQFFLESVFLYTNKNDNNLTNFLEWWEEKGQNKSVVIPEGIEAVNIMTIHKSKGLEFPIVIFPFAQWESKNNNENAWINLFDEESNLPSALIPINKSLENTSYKNIYTEESDKSNLDTLNVLYVALTRPESRLYILTGSKRTQSITTYFINFLKNTGIWEAEKTIYSFGKATAKTKNISKPRKATFVPEKNISTDWTEKISISRQSVKMWDDDNFSSSIKYGNLIHTALAGIKNYLDIDGSISSMLNAGIITLEEKQIIQKKIHELINHPEIKPFFETGLTVKNESEILLEDGSFYRPDRVIINKNEAIVIDYKTGKEATKHRNQLNFYAKLLDEIGYSKVVKYLIYTEEIRIEEVS